MTGEGEPGTRVEGVLNRVEGGRRSGLKGRGKGTEKKGKKAPD